MRDKVNPSRRQILGTIPAVGLSWLGSKLPAFAQQPQLETQSLAEVEAAARKEGKFVWYDSIPAEQCKQVLEAFQARYPEIKGESVELSTTQRVARINQESNAGGPTADFYTDLPEISMKLVEQGFVRAIDWKALGVEPNPRRTPNPYLHLTHATPCVCIYNTNNVAEADVPKTYEDTLKPRWKNRGGIWSIPFGPTQMVAAWGEEKVLDYFKKLADLSPRVYSSPRTVAEAVGAGELDIGYFIPYNTALPPVQKGAPAKIVWLEPVAMGGLFGVLPKYGAYPNASKLFLLWVASEGAVTWEKITARGNPFVKGTEMNQIMSGRQESMLAADFMVANSNHLNAFGGSLIRMLQGR